MQKAPHLLIGPMKCDFSRIIATAAFHSCDQLLEIEIPASVEEFGERCFEGCSFLSRVAFGSGSVLKRIGKEAFFGCKELREIEIPVSVEEILEGCFKYCSSMSRVAFGSGSVLKRIGYGVFSGCRDLREIEFSASDKEEYESVVIPAFLS